MDNILKVKFEIEKRELDEIENWLKEESLTSKNSFYGNWTMIIKSYSENRMAILKDKENVIGYTIWRIGDIHIEIDLFEIKPVFRRMRIGEYFINEIAKYFKKKGFLALKLFCKPEKSELFWKEMKFIKFPKRGYSESELTYFKPLIKINQSDKDVDENNKLELWDIESYEVKDSKPKWTWNIDIKNFVPILQPCNEKWNIRWTKNGKIVKECMVKYFSDQKNQIEFSEFIYIKKLVE
jgi:hypothetical protein